MNIMSDPLNLFGAFLNPFNEQPQIINGSKGHDTLYSNNNKNSVVYGYEGNDFILAGGGNDTIYGGIGNDHIRTGAGDDLLDGGSGADFMVGGAGNDTFIVDNVNDVVLEFNDGGYDTVFSSVNYTNSIFHLEKIVLTESKDALFIRGQRNDELLEGNSNNNLIQGNWGNDILLGKAGNDTLVGSWGRDTLTGGSGKDTFAIGYDNLFGVIDMGLDTITDFSAQEDKISLTRTTFTKVAREISFETVNSDIMAAISKAFIVYNNSNGKLIYNENGSLNGLGRGGEFAAVSDSLTLTSSNFVVI